MVGLLLPAAVRLPLVQVLIVQALRAEVGSGAARGVVFWLLVHSWPLWCRGAFPFGVEIPLIYQKPARLLSVSLKDPAVAMERCVGFLDFGPDGQTHFYLPSDR